MFVLDQVVELDHGTHQLAQAEHSSAMANLSDLG